MQKGFGRGFVETFSTPGGISGRRRCDLGEIRSKRSEIPRPFCLREGNIQLATAQLVTPHRVQRLDGVARVDKRDEAETLRVARLLVNHLSSVLNRSKLLE